MRSNIPPEDSDEDLSEQEKDHIALTVSTVRECLEFFEEKKFSETSKIITEEVVPHIAAKVKAFSEAHPDSNTSPAMQALELAMILSSVMTTLSFRLSTTIGLKIAAIGVTDPNDIL